ncbi:epimerase [Marinomonas sp. SBI22]|uniref:TIGR01777 family oxidoreductase n=1 Tax=unclassified Marinomonas TaxID=196814 RepID=UPI0007AEEBD0|nr:MULTISPECIES: TIGR01777 family oxidoreductase [unclassified Marinomonas]KZM43105.1 epimerase [Marinomonas sp. SBI22]KZM44676.1 epimerase [Marinomonas sp. SBI8L]
MKILMTGGTGLIGSRFINEFEQHEYTVFTRSPYQAKQDLPPQTKIINDLSKLSDLNEFDAVINLAGEPIIDKRWSQRQKGMICQSRWHTTDKLVKLFAQSDNPPEVFLSGSAVGIYGNHYDRFLPETQTTFSKDFASRLCQRWEKISQEASEHTRVVNLRTGIVLDGKGGALGKMLPIFKCNLGGKIGDGQQFMPWIHIHDMINAMSFLLSHKNCEGPFNLTSPHAVTNYQFTEELAHILDKRAYLPMPKAILKVVMGEASALLLDSQRVVPEKLIEAGFHFDFPEIEEAFADLLMPHPVYS